MEMGKDIIAIAPDGTPCAYQLKSLKNKRLTLNAWRHEIQPQILDLVAGINHPSVNKSKCHKSYLVINGKIEEEVTRSIDDMNIKWKNSNQKYELNIITEGEIFNKAKKLGINIWQSDLSVWKNVLELYLNNGKGILPKKKIANIFEKLFPFKKNEKKKIPSKNHLANIISSSAILCLISISSFTMAKNYVAEIEAWTIYLSYVLALVDKWHLPKKYWEREFEFVLEYIYLSLQNLCEELKVRKNYVEGLVLVDKEFFHVRITWLIALMSIYGLWNRCRSNIEEDHEEFIKEFCLKYFKSMELWGEAAIFQFILYFWYFKKINPTRDPDDLLADLINVISKLNAPDSAKCLANPYYEANDILPYKLGLEKEDIGVNFESQSYTIEGLINLYVRLNWKQSMKLLWPDATRISFIEFEPKYKWHYYRWHNEEGTYKTVIPRIPKTWDELKKESFESEGKLLPTTLKKYPLFVLLFLLVYPHRVNSQALRWLDSQIRKIPRTTN